VNIQFDLNDSLSGRFLESGKARIGQVIKIPGSDAQYGRDQGGQAIEIDKLPMVRKGGPMALVFDRMDSNANGVLTRAELISYRLQPMVTEMTIPAPPTMAEDSIRDAARAAEANIAEQAGDLETETPERAANTDEPATRLPALPEFAPTVPTAVANEPAAPVALPQSMPESVVMAQTSAAPEAIPA